jgi:peptide/nickel transport system substrate-binding protein
MLSATRTLLHYRRLSSLTSTQADPTIHVTLVGEESVGRDPKEVGRVSPIKSDANLVSRLLGEREYETLWELLQNGRVSRRTVLRAAGLGAVGAAGLSSFTAFLAACTSGTQSNAKPTMLNVARPSLWTTLDSEAANEQQTQDAVNVHCPALFRYKIVTDQTGFDTFDPNNFEGVLAQSYELSSDRLTYTIHLHQGALSLAGNELTADDVIYSCQRRLGIGGGGAFFMSAAMSVTSIDQVKVVDKYTITFQLPSPFDTFMHGLSHFKAGAIYDSKLMKANATSDDPWAKKFAQVNVHGFGAYKLESFVQGQQAVWVANQHFALGPPAITKMTWQVVPESASRVSLIEKGDVHIAQLMAPTEQDSAGKTTGVVIPKVGNSNYMVFLGLPAQLPVLKIPEIRQAIAYSIPYDEIIQKVYNGRARRNWSGIVETIPGADPTPWKVYTTNTDKAKQLVAQAGYPNGIAMDFGYQTSIPDLEQVAVLIRDSAAKAGITLNLKGLTDAEINQQESLLATMMLIFKDFFVVQTFIYAAKLFFSPTSSFMGYNSGRLQSDKFWRLIQQGLAVGNDSSPQAVTYYNQAQTILSQDLPFDYIAWVDPSAILRGSVGGWGWTTNASTNYYRLSFK